MISPPDIDATRSYQPKTESTSKLFAGRYKLLQTLGEGGFGIVHMAEQLDPVRRRVAIKLLRSTMDSKSVIARFESEQQALALMDHPNIARVFDGGVAEDGTPFFVMELVNGVPITEFCDAHELSNAERMQLLVCVCSAVQHAHQKGIIHRDLKPSNILVSMLDGAPVPKVIDFGIAKALHGPLTDKTLFTSFQQMIGTPEYMSPEQAEASILDVDTRSDVFSLGVLAYELLTGTTPLDGRVLRKLGFMELQRTIREVEPPKPSDRVSTLGEQATSIAIKHGLNQASMYKSIQGDLDWIVMKAMDKDRNRRYESVQSLANDLRRWLHDEPVEARPPSMFYKASKFIRRHRTQVGFASILLVAMILSAMGLGYGLAERQASIERQRNSLARSEQLQRLADLEAEGNKRLRYGNTMIAANESFRRGRRVNTLGLLKDCPEDQRGMEWQWLSHLASDKSDLLVAGTQANAQTAIAFLPGEHRLLSADASGMLRLWDTDTHKELQSWRLADEAIVAMKPSRTNSDLLVITRSGKVVLWNRDKGQAQPMTSQDVPGTIVDLFTFASGSSRAAIGGDDGSIYIWDKPTEGAPQLSHRIESTFQGPLRTLEFSSDGSQLLAAGKGGVALFSTETGAKLRHSGNSYQSYSAAFAEELNQVAFFGPPLTMVDKSTLGNPQIIEVPSADLSTGTYVKGDRSIVMATQDQCLRRIRLEFGEQETLAFYQGGSIVRLATADDGHSVAIIDQTGSLRLLKLTNYSTPTSYQAFTSAVSSIQVVSPHEVYALSDNGELAVIDTVDQTRQALEPSHANQGFSLALSSDRSRLISNGLDQQLVVWSMDSKTAAKRYGLALGARAIALHPDGLHLAGPMPSNLAATVDSSFDVTTAKGSSLAYWNLDTGRVERCFGKLTNWAMKLCFSHNGSMLAAATISDGAVLWRVDGNQPIHFLKSKEPQVDEVAFSKDDRYLFSADHMGQVHVWDVSTGSLVRTMICHSDQLSGLLTTTDGSRIITSSPSDPTFRVWDWRTGQKVAEFDSGLAGIAVMQFSKHEDCLAMGSKNGRIRVLKLR